MQSNPTPTIPRRRTLVLPLLAAAALLLGAAAEIGPTETDAEWVDVKKGLQIRDVVVGDGEEVRRGDRVSVRYAGWLEDGTLFDSNHGRALTVFEVGVGRTIKGWDLGVPGMREGGIRQLRIPHKLGYGRRGIPGRIPEKATLLFELEVKAVM